MRQMIFAGILVVLHALPAMAQTPQDVVRWIYASLLSDRPWNEQGMNYLSAPAQRGDFFTPRLVALFAANDTYGDDIVERCLPFDIAVPGNDFDASEIMRTLRLAPLQEVGTITVVAEFSNFGEPARIDYLFVPVGDVWKIDNIVNGSFRLSEVSCQPKAVVAPTPQNSNAYCYVRGADTLKVELLPGKRARIDLLSWQGGGHTCGAQMEGQQVTDGWQFPAEQGCLLGLRLADDGGLSFVDPDWACKPMLCGQRAVLEGMSFPPGSQVRCEEWQDMRN